MSRDQLATHQARKEIKEEFGQLARIQDHTGDFLAKVQYYQKNPAKLEEVTGTKIVEPKEESNVPDSEQEE
jgi:hypothetical protein